MDKDYPNNPNPVRQMSYYNSDICHIDFTPASRYNVIMINDWMRDPEAFSDQYSEYQALLADLAQEDGMFDPEDFDEDFPEDNLSDAEADADTLASAGMGTDEDYGYYGPEDGGDIWAD